MKNTILTVLAVALSLSSVTLAHAERDGYRGRDRFDHGRYDRGYDHRDHRRYGRDYDRYRPRSTGDRVLRGVLRNF